MEEQKKNQEQIPEEAMEEILDQYRDAAEAGNPMAQYDMAVAYYRNQKYEEALHWWELAAENGMNDANVRLAILHAYGLGTEQDGKQAMEYMQQAVSDPGNLEALCHLGMFYEQGVGTEQNLEKAIECYRTAAEQGSAMGDFSMGLCYFYGNGVEQDDKTAFQWMDKAVEAEYPDAQYFMGLQYYLGERVKRDMYKSLAFLQAGAENGSLDAKQLLPVIKKDISVERQMRGVNELQQMLDEYEAYMMKAADKMGYDGEDEEDEEEKEEK